MSREKKTSIEKLVGNQPALLGRLRKRMLADMDRTPEERFRMHELGIIAHRNIAEMLVENGVIDPRGKTASELQDEVQDRIGELLARGLEPQFRQIDYRDGLLREARRFVRSKHYPFAFVFYATYFEHWINLRIADGLEKRKFSHDDIKHVIQKVGDFRAKNLFLRAMQLPFMPNRTLGVVIQVAEHRNKYVHYKWTPKPMEFDDNRPYETLLRGAEKAVTRLRRIDNLPFRGKKRVLVRSISRRDFLETDQLLQEVYAGIQQSGQIMSPEAMEARMTEIRANRRQRKQ